MRLLVLFCLFITLVSCARPKQEAEKGAFSIALPESLRSISKTHGKFGALSLIPMHMVINVYENVRGGRILAKYTWDACNGPCSYGEYSTMPLNVAFEVEPGSGRLVQIMIAAGESNSEQNSGYTFLYDDEIVNMDQKEVSVTLSPYPIGSGGSEGQIEGRYLRADGTGPTGVMDIFLLPPSPDRPLVHLMSSNIFSGYFNLFYVDNSFVYRLPDGEFLFGMTPFTPANVSYANHVANFQMPEFYQLMTGPGGSSEWVLRPATNAIVGFFGDPSVLSSKKICYGSAHYVQAYLTQSTMSQVYFNPSSTVSQDARVLAGGFSTSCLSSDLQINHQLWPNQGGYRVIGIEGPYKYFSTSSETISYSHFSAAHQIYKESANQLQIDWEYLYDVFSGGSAITGTKIFYKENGADDQVYGGGAQGVLCTQLPSMGYSEVASISGATSLASIPNITESNIGTMKAVICPVRGSELFDAGVELYTSHLSMASSYDYKFDVYSATDQLTAHACTPLSVLIKDIGTGTNIPSPENAYGHMTLSGTAITSGTVYYDSSCVGAWGHSSTMIYVPSGSLGYDFYFRTGDLSGETDLSIHVQAGGFFDFDKKTYRVLPSTQLATSSFKASNLPSMPPNMCVPIEIYRTDISGQYTTLTNLGSSGAMTVGLTFNEYMNSSSITGEVQFYSDSGCSTGISSTTIPAGKISKTIFAKQTTFPGSGQSREIFITSSTITSGGGYINIGPNTVGYLDKILNENQMTGFQDGNCNSVRLVPKSVSGAPMKANSNINVTVSNLSCDGGASTSMYYESSCTTSQPSIDVAIAAGQEKSGRFYIRRTGGSPTNCSFEYIGTYSGTLNISP